ncbi:MAG: hypothetical protein K2R93_13810 [Gemmatimonadaceae bacterium]|nr:hypothetical protein [Gemmatimonadaceae bacterium]
MLMNVKGTIPRAYVSAMTPAFAYLQGSYYKPIDADGAFSSSFCYGEIRTNFRVFGSEMYTLRSCGLSYNNNDGDNVIVAEKTVIGPLRGSGSVLRTGMNQPSWPGWYNCLNGPCVIAGDASQTITMHPWMDMLSLTATPSTVYEGDSVTFTSASASGFSLVAGSQRWAWVPHNRRIGGSLQITPPDYQTGVCANGAAGCRVPVFRTGNMFVKGSLTPGPRVEQAFAKVVVNPLKLIATPMPRAVGSTMDALPVRVRTSPVERDFASISISVSAPPISLRRASLIASVSASSSCDAAAAECVVSGDAPAILTVTAITKTGVTLTTTTEVEQIPCPVGDSLLDSFQIRSTMDSLWKIGGDAPVDSARRERTALLIDSAGTLITRYQSISTLTTPCQTPAATEDIRAFLPPNWVPGVMKIVASFHTHPFKQGQQTPGNCRELSYQWMQTGPSASDWHTSVFDAYLQDRYYRETLLYPGLLDANFRHVVIEPDRIWVMKQPTSWRPVITPKGVTNFLPDYGKLKPAVKGWERTTPRNSHFCLSPSSKSPYFNP